MSVSSDKATLNELGEELLAIAADAAAADNLDLSIKLARLAVQCNPTPRALTFLADRVASSGDAEEVIRLYRHMLDVRGVPMDASIALALGYAEAERGNFREALNYFWRVTAIKGESNELWFFIGTCYAMMREFAAANNVFVRNIVLPLSDGHATSTALLRLPQKPDLIRRVKSSELPFRRHVAIDADTLHANPAVKGADAIHLICCDSRYFSLFGRAVVQSVALRSGAKLALHFHIINPTDADDALGEKLRADSGVPIAYTKETVDFGAMTQEQIRTYYTCARFLLLPDLQAHYGKLILVTDADQTVIRPLGRFLDIARGHDAGVLLFPRARYNILAVISASVCVSNTTSGSTKFFAAVRDYILERMTDPAGLAWHLDQAALVAAYLACQDVDVWLIPPKTMVSKTLKKQIEKDDETLFWSVTYSIEANAQKLNTSEFLQFVNSSHQSDSMS